MSRRARADRIPVVRVAFAALRRIGGAVRLAVDEAVAATDPDGPGGTLWTREEIDALADAIGDGVADLAREALLEVLGRRGRLASQG